MQININARDISNLTVFLQGYKEYVVGGVDEHIVKGTIEYSWDNQEYYLLGDDDKYYKLENGMEILFY